MYGRKPKAEKVKCWPELVYIRILLSPTPSGRLQIHLRQSLERILIRVQQRLDPRPLRHERLVLMQQLGEQFWSIQRRNQPILDVPRSVVHEQMHDCLRYQVFDRLPDDAEIRRDE